MQTNVVGFFNPNTWKVCLHSSKLGLNNIIIEPSKYVVDAEGNKINDPRLEGFVGPNMLAKQISDAPVPVREIVLASQRPAGMGSPGFSSSAKVPDYLRPPSITQAVKTSVDRAARAPAPAPKSTARQASVPPRTPPTATVTTVAEAATHNPVRGMSMADARKLGLVAKTFTPAPEGIPDDPNQEVAKTAPQIGFARDGGPARTAVPPAQAIPIVPVKGGIAESMAESQAVDPDAPDAVSEVLRTEVREETTVPEPTTPLPTTPVPTSNDLPEPRLPPPEQAFVCAADNRTFKNRAALLRHVRKSFADQEAVLMAPYPRAEGRVVSAWM